MDEIKLPIEIDPIIKSYHYATFPMSIIQANGGDRIIPWLCKKYINCCFDLRAVRNHFLICLYDSYGVEDHVLNHQHICLADYEYAELNILFIIVACYIITRRKHLLCKLYTIYIQFCILIIS